MLSISVIIPSHYRPETLQRCLLSVYGQYLPAPLEIVVCINQDDEISAKCLKQTPTPTNIDLLVLTVNTPGVNAKRNSGWKNSTGTIVHFLDDDCHLPDKNFYQRVFQHYEAHNTLFVGGPYKNASGQKSICSDFYNWWSYTWLKLHQGKVLLGGNFFVDRSVDVLFDESIEYGGTETEFFLRQSEIHWNLLEEHFVYHSPSITPVALISRIFRQNLGPKVEINYKMAFQIFLCEFAKRPVFVTLATFLFIGLLTHRAFYYFLSVFKVPKVKFR